MYYCAFIYFPYDKLKPVLIIINFTYYMICMLLHIMCPLMFLLPLYPMVTPLDHELNHHAAWNQQPAWQGSLFSHRAHISWG
uniref:Orcinus orca mitochondrial D-loop region DNA n=1 Tax=Orcinus orca TaxID=9733 RepID=Q9ZZM9_ORCOR|nr:ORF [Orcinus orca]